MSAYEITILQRFKAGLLEFLDKLVEWMPEDEEILTTRLMVENQFPIEDVLKKFATHLLPLADKITNREESFFLGDPKVFGNVKDQGRVLSLKKLWTNPNFTAVDKECAWKFMAFFLKCVTLYKQHSKDV